MSSHYFCDISFLHPKFQKRIQQILSALIVVAGGGIVVQSYTDPNIYTQEDL